VTTRRLVVIGGGIAGLAAAWAAREADKDLEIVLLERAREVGGKARTIVRGEWMVEAGPTGFLSGTPELDRLITACGLDDSLRPADPAAARRFIRFHGRTRRVAPNPVSLVSAGLLTAGGCARMLAEVAIRARRDQPDESVWDFAARRLGTEVADRLISPMMLGVFAGDAHRLSFNAAFPRMAALEREHGSLIRGMIARAFRRPRGTKPAALHSFDQGMQTLPRSLASRGDFEVRCNADVREITRTASSWSVAIAGQEEAITTDAIVVAAPPAASATLLRNQHPVLASELDGIYCPPVAVVALGYGPGDWDSVPPGFGVLVARGEGFRMLGNLWDTHLYSGRSPAGHLLIRAMYGGGIDPDAAALPTAELVDLARSEVARLYGLHAAPCFEEAVHWAHAIPQYELGHPERVRRIEHAVADLPGIFLTGSGLRGVAFPAAAADGVRTGEAAARWLAAASA
jgi:oxygen-dependent protoporphyrinogen oxidase